MQPNAHKHLIKITTHTILFISGIVLIAVICFVIGFGLGARKLNIEKNNSTTIPLLTPQISEEVTPITTPSTNISPSALNPDVSCNQDSDCILDDTNRKTVMQICCNNTCSNYFDASVIAVNKNWFQGYKGSVCFVRQLCPMYAMMCTKEATLSHQQVTVACQNHVCTKVTQ